MRKSSFGHRPPRGKPQDGGSGPRGRPAKPGPGPGHGKSRRDGEDGAKKPFGARFRKRGPEGGGKSRRDGEDGAKKPFGARVRKRGPEGGGRRAEPGVRAERSGTHAPSGKPQFRKRPGGRPGGPRGQRAEQSGASVSEPMRIAKAMARAGLCSRREAERWIADGRVSVNGQTLKTPGVEVKPRDRVLVDGQPLPIAEPSQLWRYNKPRGLVTTHNDPQGRPTVFDSLPPGLPRVISVGRLDFNTEGLILLTNDGELARHLELPATGWLRRYRVRAKGRVTPDDLEKLKEGIEIEGVRYGPVEAVVDTVQGANIWLTVGIREGKNREVRKVLSSLQLDVNRLIRISFGPFQLLDLEPGEVDVVKRRVLADQLGPDIAKAFMLVDPETAEKSAKQGRGRQRVRPRPNAKPRRGDA